MELFCMLLFYFLCVTCFMHWSAAHICLQSVIIWPFTASNRNPSMESFPRLPFFHSPKHRLMVFAWRKQIVWLFFLLAAIASDSDHCTPRHRCRYAAHTRYCTTQVFVLPANTAQLVRRRCEVCRQKMSTAGSLTLACLLKTSIDARLFDISKFELSKSFIG